MTTTRILPLEPPYAPDVAEALAKWMPAGFALPPLALFRTIARHPMLRDRMRPLGSGLLARGSLPPRVRELLILRTSARCGAGYEWSVHVAAYARTVGLDDATIAATVAGTPATDDDALVTRIADELHDHSTLSDATFAAAHAAFGDEGMLEIAALCGFYHLIAYVIGVAGVAPEPWAPAFPAINAGS